MLCLLCDHFTWCIFLWLTQLQQTLKVLLCNFLNHLALIYVLVQIKSNLSLSQSLSLALSLSPLRRTSTLYIYHNLYPNKVSFTPLTLVIVQKTHYLEICVFPRAACTSAYNRLMQPTQEVILQQGHSSVFSMSHYVLLQCTSHFSMVH